MRLLVLAALAVAGCSDPVLPPRIDPPSFTVAVHWETSASLQQVARAYGQTAEVDGFTIVRADGRCDIHMVEPRSLNEATQELLGHEFAHCLFGSYHP